MTSKKRAGAYLRVSEDPSKGGRSIDSQLVQARKDAAANGATLADDDVFTETKSASVFGRRRGTVRTEWAKFLEALPEWDLAILPEISRGTRELSAYQDLTELCVEHSVRLCAKSRILDFDDEADVFLGGIEVLQADAEARRISRRVYRGISGANAAGRAPAGRTPFGFDRPGRKLGEPVIQIVNEKQAEAIRKAAKGVIDRAKSPNKGESLKSICARWEMEFPERNWTPAQVRAVLRNPALIAKRVHKDTWHPGAWPPILDVPTFDRLAEIFSSRETGTQRPSTTLLASVVECGVCESSLKTQRRRGRKETYRCMNGHVSVPMDEVDPVAKFETIRMLVWEVFDRLGSGEFDKPDMGRVESAEKITAQAKADLEEWYSEGAKSGLPASEVARMALGYRQVLEQAESEEKAARAAVETRGNPQEGIRAQTEYLREHIAGIDEYESRVILTLSHVSDVWENATLDQQRATVARFLTIRARPAGSGKRVTFEAVPGAPTSGPDIARALTRDGELRPELRDETEPAPLPVPQGTDWALYGACPTCLVDEGQICRSLRARPGEQGLGQSGQPAIRNPHGDRPRKARKRP